MRERPTHIGHPHRRENALRHLAGRGNYVSDLQLPHMVHSAFLRSPMAHGRITALNVEAARTAPGVIAVFTAADLNTRCESWISHLGHFAGMVSTPQNILAEEEVLWVGHPVAMVVARTRLAAMKLSEAFRARETKKTYWALVKGVPPKREDKISTWLIKEPTADGDRVRIAKHGEKGADHAVSYYRVVEQAAQSLSWLEMEPYTGRTHQLRVHAAHIGCPIIGDPKYFEADTNWEFPGGIQNRLHLHARRIVIPHPDGGVIDVTAPMPPHMRQSWNLLGFDEQSAED